MKKTTTILLILLLFSLTLSGCYKIDSTNQSDYSAFYEKIKTIMPSTYSMLPAPDSWKSIDDIYLYYSDYDLIDSYYTIYLECTFAPEQFETEKQRVMDDASQYDFTLYNSDVFSYDSAYINQCLISEPDGFIAIQISYALFDTDNNKIIYVDTFEEGTKSEWKSAHIPDKYLPSDLIDLIK